jgi:RNA polymerase sigma-70 factor, ECF subfamily
MSLHDPLLRDSVSSPSGLASTALLVGAAPDQGAADGDDEVLMARIAAGDQAAFHSFTRCHVARCLAVAQRIIGNPSDAEEAVQDALLRVWLHAPEYRAGGARATTWLYRIVVNQALDTLRRNRRRLVPIDDAGDPVDPAPDAQMLAEGRQLETFIAQAIGELPARQRTALALCYFEAMDCGDAAEIMQISVSAMESLLVRGRRTLRARLHPFAGDAARRAPCPARVRRYAPGNATALALPLGGLAGSPA